MPWYDYAYDYEILDKAGSMNDDHRVSGHAARGNIPDRTFPERRGKTRKRSAPIGRAHRASWRDLFRDVVIARDPRTLTYAIVDSLTRDPSARMPNGRSRRAVGFGEVSALATYVRVACIRVERSVHQS